MNTNNRTDKNKLYMGKDRNANPHKHESSEVFFKKKEVIFLILLQEKKPLLSSSFQKSHSCRILFRVDHSLCVMNWETFLYILGFRKKNYSLNGQNLI